MTKLIIKYVACEDVVVEMPIISIVVTKSVKLFLFAKFRNDRFDCWLLPGYRLCSSGMTLLPISSDQQIRP